MEQLDPPDPLLWDERRLWFEEQQTVTANRGAGVLSEQGVALTLELQVVFCAGAWAACIVLAAAVVEMQSERSKLRRAVDPKDLNWLRGRRNELVHENQGDPAFTVEDHWTRRPEWEKKARRAVQIAFQVLYAREEKA